MWGSQEGFCLKRHCLKLVNLKEKVALKRNVATYTSLGSFFDGASIELYLFNTHNMLSTKTECINLLS